VAGRRHYNQDRPIANGLDVLGERWTLLIVRELVGGPRRYSDLCAQLPGIATNLLAQRLDELEQADVVARTELPAPIARTVYTLSDDGWRPRGGFTIAESRGEIADRDAQVDRPRLAGELKVVMHEGDRYAALTDGCCHALH
jgi:DNA-binding HxlR family transcriptional regulator